MFITIENQFFHLKNLLYFEYDQKCLTLEFAGSLNSRISQEEEDFINFREHITSNSKDLNIMMLNSFAGVNSNTVSGIVKKENCITFHFIDGFMKDFPLIEMEEISKLIQQDL